MAAPQIEADYELLEEVSSRFVQQGDAIDQMLQNIRNNMDNLQGEWIGEGSEAFFNEMTDLVIPAVQRLSQALHQTGSTTKQISTVMSGAEEESSNSFQVYVS